MQHDPLGPVSFLGEVLNDLARTIDARAGADPASSWTAKLLMGGPALTAKKLGEEGVDLLGGDGDGAGIAVGFGGGFGGDDFFGILELGEFGVEGGFFGLAELDGMEGGGVDVMLDPPDGADCGEEATSKDDACEDEDWFFPGSDGGRGFVHCGSVLNNVAIQHG
jgi:hypothetical protein